MTIQVPQVFFKLFAWDLMLVSSYEVADIVFCESLVISEAISDYGAQAFTLHSPRASLPFYLITCSSPHRTSKDGDILHSSGHLLLTLGADFTSHGLMFKATIYNLNSWFFLRWFEFSSTFCLSLVDLSFYTWVQFLSCNCLCS